MDIGRRVATFGVHESFIRESGLPSEASLIVVIVLSCAVFNDQLSPRNSSPR